MQKVLFYSPDFDLCYSLLMYLQDKYIVTTSTDFNVLISLINNSEFDLVIIDSEPNKKIESFCSAIKNSPSDLKIILTYVYNKKMSATENRMRDCISAVFYKPFDLTDISNLLPGIITSSTAHV